MLNLELFFGIVPALILFLYGIENFTKEIQNLAGEKFRRFLRKSTKNPASGALLGAAATAIVQSSSATTVITVSLVNAGIISFTQSLGIIFGSNVGTSVTAQLIALKLTAFAPIFIIVGFLLKFTKGKYKVLGKPLFFFGLVFYGLMLVSNNIAPIQNDPAVVSLFSNFSNLFIALAVGFIITALVQSSSVTTGLVVVLAQSGLIDLRMGIPLLIGANIGSSTTALIASLDLNLYAKRVGVANFMFNLGGAIIFIPLISVFIKVVESVGGSVAQQVANAHVIFNLATLVIFLIIINYFKKVIERLVPGEEEEILFKAKYLGEALPKGGTRAIKLIKKEIVYSIEITEKIYAQAINMFKQPSRLGFMKLEKLETLNDFLDDRITHAILQLSHKKLTKNEAKKMVLLVQISNAIEQLGDLGKDLGEISKDVFDKGMHMKYESIEVVDKVFIDLKKNLVHLQSTFPNLDRKSRAEIKKREDHVLSFVSYKYAEHLTRLQEDKEYRGSTFVESIAIMETAVSKQREIRKFMGRYTKLG